jgi:hypothetical protein
VTNKFSYISADRFHKNHFKTKKRKVIRHGKPNEALICQNINSSKPCTKPQALPENMSPQIFVCLHRNLTYIGKNSPAQHQWCMKKFTGGAY